jgi:hypothetical protein
VNLLGVWLRAATDQERDVIDVAGCAKHVNEILTEAGFNALDLDRLS